jgi:hypothetical protein
MPEIIFDPLLATLEQELRTDFHQALTELLTTARTRLEEALAEVARERARGLAEVATQKAKLRREIVAMQTHAEKQQGRVELNIGGHRFQTSVQTLRRLPHTFFDAYFSGRYAQDVCLDGSIFVDRDGEHFGHLLEYMRDGVVSVAEADAHPSVSLLRALKREFGYYCVELMAEEPAEAAQLETVYVMGGEAQGTLLSMEQYNAVSGQWSAAAVMGNVRLNFGTCVIASEIYVTGGLDTDGRGRSTMEKYSPQSDTLSAVVPVPVGMYMHSTVAVGSDMYVLGGSAEGVYKFDSKQGTWNEVEPPPRVIFASAAIAVGTDIYVFGGFDEVSFGIEEDCVYKYDTLVDAWSALAPMPHACCYHSASICNGIVYIVGAGAGGHEVLRFNPASAEWSTLGSTCYNRRGGSSFVLGGILYVAGGGMRGNTPSVDRYNPDADTWTAVADMLEGRSSFGARPRSRISSTRSSARPFVGSRELLASRYCV